MNRRIWLPLLAPLLFLTGTQASAGTISLQGLLSAGACTAAPDPVTPGGEFGSPTGCWQLLNRNADGTDGGPATGFAVLGFSSATLTGSDANTVDPFTGLVTAGPLIIVDPLSGAITPLGTLTQFTSVITETTPGLSLALDGITLSGDLTFDWYFTTADAGSIYDSAGYFLCAATPTGFPSNICGLYQLTTDIDALNPADPFNPPPPPFAESGSVTVTLVPGDVFGAYVLTSDNANGAGTITFSDPTVSAPEPATFLLIGTGLVGLGWVGRKRAAGIS